MRKKASSSLFLFIFVWLGAGSLMAQVQLERISITERGDGNGYVVRYHLNDMVQEYEVRQPEPNQIRMQLLSEGLDTAGIELPMLNSEIAGFLIERISGGIGVSLETAENVFFRAEAYPDQNMRDLLLSLEYVNEQEAVELSRGMEPFAWAVRDQAPSDTQVSETAEAGDEEDSQDQERAQGSPDESAPVVRWISDGWKVRFGASGGVSSANVSGASYGSNPRRDILLGITAIIDTPLRLPYGIEAGIRSGIWMTKKGFMDPTDLFEVKEVALDYIDVPVMLNAAYSVNRYLRPAISLGFNTSFKAGFETIGFEGERSDLDESVRTVNAGLIGGIGTDVLLGEAGLTFQVVVNRSLTPVFKDGVSGSEKHTLMTGMVTLWF